MKSLNQKDREGESKIERRLAELERQFLKVPSRWPQPVFTQILRIIGGNLLNGVQQIAYVPDASLSPIPSLYKADVDTSFIDGIGNAWLYDDRGRPEKRVLVRHNCAAYTDPVPIDRTFLAGPTVTLSVTGGPDNGKQMTFYTLLRG
jgi:hypothetical protein